jgi:hypothetical protein
MPMSFNLFEIYRGLSQRVRRNPGRIRILEAKNLGRVLLEPDISKDERIKIAKSIEKIEREDGVRVSFGRRAIMAIENNNWIIDVPYQVQHRWNERQKDQGFFYIASARSRPGELKIGATSDLPWRRESSYQCKYGYSIKIEWYVFTRMPFALEKDVADRIVQSRVSGLTYNDSNEWYRIDLTQLVGLVEEIKGQNSASGKY